MNPKLWRNAVDWALAAGLTAEQAIAAADRREADEKIIRAAYDERFTATGQPRPDFFQKA